MTMPLLHLMCKKQHNEVTPGALSVSSCLTTVSTFAVSQNNALRSP